MNINTQTTEEIKGRICNLIMTSEGITKDWCSNVKKLEKLMTENDASEILTEIGGIKGGKQIRKYVKYVAKNFKS